MSPCPLRLSLQVRRWWKVANYASSASTRGDNYYARDELGGPEKSTSQLITGD